MNAHERDTVALAMSLAEISGKLDSLLSHLSNVANLFGKVVHIPPAPRVASCQSPKEN